ncbi:MAG TPA: 50S ribosomal protein L18 [Alphaproteobacteria bacterium]|nr:50S ribosomal protein L18 [Alphaproteobacteria bacterium]HAJ45539.1 50S ribosomal protein L18 [Alphaproteobacteria bacterium]
MALKPTELFERRKERNRSKLKRVATGRPRLCVFRSQRHIYAQIIDDAKGETLAQASSLDTETKPQLGKPGQGADVASAKLVGRIVAERAVKAGVRQVVFDRGGYIYHGRVKALADAAREAGLEF